MRLLWHSTSPICNTGYGNVTRQVVTRLRDAGHFVRIGTKHAEKNWHEWNGFEIFEGIDTLYVNQMLEDEAFDYIVTGWDIWQLKGKRPYPTEKWVAHVPVDTEQISADLAEVVKQAGTVAAMSRHGERELRAAGFDPLYMPLGIDTKRFRPKPAGRKAFRDGFGWDDDIFLIGSVGLNYRDDRKGFITLMKAFKEFHESHDEARLYLHTLADERGNMADCINYQEIAVSLGIDKWLTWPNQPDYALGRIDEEQLCDIYNAFDVFCLPTKGEGFGIPIVEAQACGVPVIVTDSTTGPELCKTGWLIDVDRLDDSEYMLIKTWRIEPRPSKVLGKLDRAYREWTDKEYYGRLREKTALRVREYDWENIWRQYWAPVFKTLEERLADGSRDHPAV